MQFQLLFLSTYFNERSYEMSYNKSHYRKSCSFPRVSRQSTGKSHDSTHQRVNPTSAHNLMTWKLATVQPNLARAIDCRSAGTILPFKACIPLLLTQVPLSSSFEDGSSFAPSIVNSIDQFGEQSKKRASRHNQLVSSRLIWIPRKWWMWSDDL